MAPAPRMTRSIKEKLPFFCVERSILVVVIPFSTSALFLLLCCILASTTTIHHRLEADNVEFTYPEAYISLVPLFDCFASTAKTSVYHWRT